jgi:ankyrin repeat protein
MHYLGPPLYKQLKFAILEGNEEKAIGIYNGKEMGKALKDTLHPSKPFPSKKDPNGETPLHLSAKYALPVLFGMFLQFGGRPDIVNSRRESCVHTACTEANHPARRAEIVEQALKWRSVNPSTNKAVAVAIDGGDLEGNTAMHLAAYNGLLLILEKLIAYRASSYVLNHGNLTSPEYADVSGRANIGTMIELAALFAPSPTDGRVSDAMNRYMTVLREYRSSGLGVLVLDSHSLTASGLMKFITRTIAMVAEALKETPSRAEVMLMHYRWDARELIADYQRNASSVARAVKIQLRGQGRGSDGDDSQALVVKNGKCFFSCFVYKKRAFFF